MSTVDVLIVGGGPAGLASALTLSRARHTSVVFDSGDYRNGLSSHVHNVPTHDHKSPSELRAAARAELTDRYKTVQLVDKAVTAVRKTEQGTFVAVDSAGKEWIGRKVILATGNQDVLPDVPGYADAWVKGIFHCLYCHGYEESGTPSAGILAVGDLAVALPHTNIFARNAAQFASQVTIYTDGAESVAEQIKPMVANRERQIKVDSRKITKLVKAPEGTKVEVHFEDGETITEGFLAHKPKNSLNVEHVKDLGLELMPSGTELKVSMPFNETSCKGVFAAGDMATVGKVIATAVFLGQFAAQGAVMQLQAASGKLMAIA